MWIIDSGAILCGPVEYDKFIQRDTSQAGQVCSPYISITAEKGCSSTICRGCGHTKVWLGGKMNMNRPFVHAWNLTTFTEKVNEPAMFPANRKLDHI